MLLFVSLTWARTYGDTSYEYACYAQQTADAGYIVAGFTASYGAGVEDFLVIKLDSFGAVQWAKTYGDTIGDYAYSVQQTADAGYIVAGWTVSYGAGSADFLVMKLNSAGAVQWSRTYGGPTYDFAYSIQQTADSGYIVAGVTQSYGAGDTDFLVIKLNSAGAVQWAKTYGDSAGDGALFVQQTYDGGYIAAGWTYSYGAGKDDFLVMKLNSAGAVQWSKTYGDTSSEGALSVQQTADSGYIVAGVTKSYGAGEEDFFVIKLNPSGDIDWAKTYGGDTLDFARSIQQTADSGYIVAGWTYSYGAGWYDFLVMKLNSAGAVDWAKTYGNTNHDYACYAQQTSDGGYIVAGHTVSYGAGWFDFYVVKTDENGIVPDTLGVCEGVDWSPTVTSPTVTVNSPSPDTFSPSVGADCSPAVSSPAVTVTTVCEPPTGIEEREIPKSEIRNPKLIDVIPTLGKKFNIKYTLGEDGVVTIKLHDKAGREVCTLWAGYTPAGEHNLLWDASETPSGIYFCTIKADGIKQSKLVVVQ